MLDLAVVKFNPAHALMLATDSATQFFTTLVFQVVLVYTIVVTEGLGGFAGLALVAGCDDCGSQCRQTNANGDISCFFVMTVIPGIIIILIVIISVGAIVIVGLYPTPLYPAAEGVASASIPDLAINPEPVMTDAFRKNISEIAYAISITNRLFAFLNGFVLFIRMRSRTKQHGQSRSQ